ncbi:MAG: pyridoxamine 5'-phosphate oxidase family protein [Humidesulfovibrio sp.]|jgi:hypothetical protein|uniref:pyridoxamine 5'-phosphate oxidase family protein n=1 Tax=Humidesulfovibrio sp. TaxID=2910988 RepID=UPI0027349A77|nr:pyridoxamine 5'-phosphate oxidase family protein [Humidesulfovibrio sp.]MDP2848570.1 pyridoxamine 5'-phosphate oxidase family protein [Humidesulfovibrio sp.]
MLKKIAMLVQAQGHCVLATCDCDGEGAAPHTSLMSCCASDDCGEFWLATRTDTRKFRNLSANPRASLLVDDRAGGERAGQPGLALTVAARLESFATAADQDAARLALLARHPGLESFLAQEQTQVLRLVAVSFQLLTGLSEVFFVEAEKVLDARTRKA